MIIEIVCAWCQKRVAVHHRNRFCGRSCSAKWRMTQPEVRAKVYTQETALKISQGRVAYLRGGSAGALATLARIAAFNKGRQLPVAVRAKVSAALRARKWKPPVQGGNGKPLPVPHQRLWTALGHEWEPDFPVALKAHGFYQIDGYPTCYKIDLAHVTSKLAIEVDGYSHASRRALDEKKTRVLSAIGWTVLRFTNQEVLSSLDSVVERVRLHSMTCKSQGIPPIPFMVRSFTTQRN